MAATSLSRQFNEGDENAGITVTIEETNLRHGLKLGLQLENWAVVMGTLHALEDLYAIQNSASEWRKLVGTIEPLVTDLGTGKSLPGRELAWRSVTEYRMRIAAGDGDHEQAERYARVLVDAHKAEAAPYLAEDSLAKKGGEEIHNLAVMIDSLGTALAHQGSAECVTVLQEAFALSVKIGDSRQAAVSAQNLGWAYREVKQIQDATQALTWLHKGLELCPKNDEALRAKLIIISAGVLFNSFIAKIDADLRDEALEDGATAIAYYLTASSLLPEHALVDRAEALMHAGAIFLRVGAVDKSEPLLREALPLARAAGSVRFEAAILFNLASALKEQNRLNDAIDFALAAEGAATRLGSEGESLSMQVLELLAEIRARQKQVGHS
jgi:tetratricopeptide (TPR) repeat protein